MLSFLLSIADEGRQAQIEYLYYTYHDDMMRFAKYRLRLCGDFNYDMDAQDVVQNAFVKITKYTHAVDFTLSYNELRAYVLTIVTNEANNLLKENKTYEELDDCLTEEAFFEALRIKDRYYEVIEAIESLDDRYSIALLYRYRENMSIKELAALLGIAEKSVYTRIERGRKLLLKSLEKEK